MSNGSDDTLPNIPGSWGVDTDPETEEDGRGDNVDQPLPEVDPDQFIEEG